MDVEEQTTDQGLLDLLRTSGALRTEVQVLIKDDDPRQLQWADIPLAVQHIENAVDALRGMAVDASSPARQSELAGGLLKRVMRTIVRQEEEVESSITDTTFRTAPEKPADFEGSCATITLPDLIGFLGSQRKNGRLTINCPSEVFVLYLENGALVHAHGNRPDKGHRLGDILVEHGACDRASLERFVHANAGKERLGDALAREELITRDQLSAALETQFQQLFYRLFTADNARFKFREGEMATDSNIKLSVMELLLESARALDESVDRAGKKTKKSEKGMPPDIAG